MFVAPGPLAIPDVLMDVFGRLLVGDPRRDRLGDVATLWADYTRVRHRLLLNYEKEQADEREHGPMDVV